jgi:hypothetical protein
MRHTFLIFLAFLIVQGAGAQQPLELRLEDRGEVVVSFDVQYLKQLPNLGSWSVDKVSNNIAYVYLNAKQYAQILDLNIPFVPEPSPSLISEVKMANTWVEAQDWDTYPDYETYLALMTKFTTDFPELCKLDTIGYSTNNRLLLALKISDNVNNDEAEPEFFYTSSMHGNELTGYVLMLRLADYLLNNYESDAIKNLVDNMEIYINPLANPDGTFYTSNYTVSGATRYNANSVDINRNFKDPWLGDHPDGNVWQEETLAMMDFMGKHNFSLSMNFHGGAEVLNYPYDGTYDRHPDDAWWQFICRAYADTVHTIDSYYLIDFENGITNGADWYVIDGGRQDYVTHFLHGREVTAEISAVKLPSASELPEFWENNYRSLLQYMQQGLFGVQGLVTDVIGNPLQAKVSIEDYDKDSSFVRTQTEGVFYRYLKAGSYNLLIKANGYETKTVSVEVIDFQSTPLHVTLDKLASIDANLTLDFMMYPNPANDRVTVVVPEGVNGESLVKIVSLDGKLSSTYPLQGNESVNLNLTTFSSGLYFVKLITTQGSKTQKLFLK